MTITRRPIEIQYVDFDLIDRIRRKRFEKYKSGLEVFGNGGDPPGQGDEITTFNEVRLCTFTEEEFIRVFN